MPRLSPSPVLVPVAIVALVAWLGLAAVATVNPAQAGGAAAQPQPEGKATAVFDFDLIDDSTEGEINGIRPDETARLALISAELKRALIADGRYRLVDLSPIAADIERARPMYKCNQCEDDLARKVGADFLMIGTVQKVSNLILNLNLYVRDVKAGKIVQVMSSDIRSNTDESWIRGVRYVIKNQLLSDTRPGQQ
jgi:hypothetical protein